MKSRKLLVAGNWKMNLGPAAAAKLAAQVDPLARANPGVDVALFAPFVSLPATASALAGGPVRLGAQNAHELAAGAFTGEVSAAMLAEICSLVLLGHSERRHVYGESSELIGAKVATALATSLDVMLCVGETLDQRQADATDGVIREQLQLGLRSVDQSQIGRLSIAYEPVWAIGTGHTASPDQAGAAAGTVRGWISERFGSAAADLRVLYGGSVNPDNWAEIAVQEDIDGALVGGASLAAQIFGQLITIAQGVQ